jgi:magnesium transporter
MKAEETIAREYMRNHPREAGRVLDDMEVEDLAAFLESFDRGAAALALQNMESSTGIRCLALWSDEVVTDVLKLLPVAHSGRMLRLMEPSNRRRMLSLVTPDRRQTLNKLLNYPEASAASLMNTRHVAFPRDLRVDETWKRLRRRQRRSGYYLYVVDLEGILVGAMGFNELLSADPRRELHALMSQPVESLSAFASVDAILDHPGWRRFPELPVVDESGALLGLIKYSSFKDLEHDRKGRRPWTVLNSGLALGELYWAGSSQLLWGLLGTVLADSHGSTIEEDVDGH